LRRLWALAEACTPEVRVAAYTQAIMDLGATLCTRARPACDRCPLAGRCGARAAGRTAAIPVPRRRAPRRERQAHVVFVVAGGRVLLERRPPLGIWGGLWTPPEFKDAAAARAWLAERHAVREPTRRLATLRHAFTHFDLVIEPWVLDRSAPAAASADGEARWHELDALEAVGVPAPVARLLEELKNGANGPVREARPRGGRPRKTAVSG
jgi:A/G-specific adenine glycosylase